MKQQQRKTVVNLTGREYLDVSPEHVREEIAKALRETSSSCKVVVYLDEFWCIISRKPRECFGGLIEKENFSLLELTSRLEIAGSHRHSKEMWSYIHRAHDLRGWTF